MVKSINIYSRLKVSELGDIVENYKVNFEQQLNDFFSEEELKVFESKLDTLAAVFVQPMISELSFDDFYFDPKDESELRNFFLKCESSILLDNIPYFETNPFQVTYLIDLLELLDEAIVDKGGVANITFKDDFLKEFKTYDGIESILPKVKNNTKISPTSLPIQPIDFLILDVYKELDRLKHQQLDIEELPLKVQRIFEVAKEEKLDAHALFQKTALNPKDFDDGLEKLKFWLRKK